MQCYPKLKSEEHHLQANQVSSNSNQNFLNYPVNIKTNKHTNI